MSEIPPRLLRETLGGSPPSDPSGCLDADTVAAWADGTLRARARTAAEAHASSCARCQALLAAMVRTAPEAPPARHWRAWLIGLAAPIAAAAALLVWLDVPQAPFRRAMTSPPAAAAAATPTIAKSEQAAPPASEVTVPPAAATDRAAGSKGAVPARAAAAPPVAPAPVQQSARADQERAKKDLESKLRQTQPIATLKEARERSADAAAPAAPPRAEAAPPPPVTAAELAPRATASNAAAAAPAAPPVPPSAMASSRAIDDQAAARVRGQSLAKTAAAPADIAAPNSNVRWRILTGGSIARSIDGGFTWQTQSTGVAVTLTAGAAPAPLLCWLVGLRGTVIVSTDGRNWQRVPFPEAIDLTSIRASDRANATVTTADGRTFTTTDGGTTWRTP
jgi:hypothetical protein